MRAIEKLELQILVQRYLTRYNNFLWAMILLLPDVLIP